MYYSLSQKRNEFVPLLFTLRRPEAIDSLTAFITRLEEGRNIKTSRTAQIVLLVDGYDEVNKEHRQVVSGLLMRYHSLQLGRFYLSCRSHYDVYDLKILYCHLAPFRDEDTLGFIRAFARSYGTKIEANLLVAELHAHGFDDFCKHPLMLALVCILKTGPNKEIPRRAIGLIRRAIDTLTFRWDEAKYISRESRIAVDGEERVRCLMRVAFYMRGIQAPWADIEKSVRRHLELLQMQHTDASVLIREITQ